MRDNIPVGDDSQTPLQFIFEPANCRIYYDFTTANQPHKLWEYVADIAWKGKKCAWGSMNTNVTVNGTSNSTVPGTVSPSIPQQVTKSDAPRRIAVFSTIGAVVGVAVMMQLL